MFKSILVTGLLLLSGCVLAQRYSISGVIRKADSNQPLPGATVQLEGENKFTIADEFGRYSIGNISAGEYTIVFSFIGFETSSQKLTLSNDQTLDVSLGESAQLTDEVVVYATRANEETPIAYTNVTNQTLQRQNFGQDLPILLSWTPSLVTTSDAGAGVGYTGLRIRGSDATRINVTINGIPYNDAESQGTFWVDIPDIASSTQSVQIQRGVGTSSNGAGSFGGSINVQTLSSPTKAYGAATIGLGSFNTQRYTVKAGSGLINNHWTVDVRASKINSDGYIDRATSDLKSYYVSAGYQSDKTIVKAIVFGGAERTYQAWYGVDEFTMKENRTFNWAGVKFNDDWTAITGYHDDEVDDYKQDHYQLHFSRTLNTNWNANFSLHYTHGRGYYEQYKQAAPFTEFGLDPIASTPDDITYGDFIVRKWLDNDFYGTTFSLNYDNEKMSFTTGGAYNEYANARHFGEVVWAQYTDNVTIPYVYYDGESKKTDFNIFTKLTYRISDKVSAFGDLQLRTVSYKTAGTDDNLSDYSYSDDFTFFNPKAGVTFQASDKSTLYASYALANREPNRTDYTDGVDKPRPERLHDVELGLKKQVNDDLQLDANVYYMYYKDQLVFTGEVNDVGDPIRKNVGESYRTGIELSAMARIAKNFMWNVNTTLSSNKNINSKSFLADKGKTEIVLSPSVIMGSQLIYTFKNFHATLLSKYVGTQYLDNSENDDLKLDAYFVNDLRVGYSFAIGKVNFDISGLVNNVLDTEYSSNGYSWGDTAYYFPQAGRNYMGMLTIKF